jgi:surfeit locus 1 family protein
MMFRPRKWPTILTIAMLPILIGLGTWQLHRRVWKENLLASIAAGMNAPSIALADRIDDPQGLQFHAVSVRGRLDPDHEFHLYGRTFDGKAGIHLVVPLIRDSGDPVLVDRGFVPFDQGSTLATYAKPAGPVELPGVVRTPEPAGWFMPASRPDDNIWYSVDIAAMAAASGLSLAPIYVAAKPSGDPGWPRGTGGTEALGIRNEHLNYAIFWYSMAAALVAIYILSSRGRRA